MSSTSPNPAWMASFLGSNKYTDLTLVCQGREYRVHRVTVCGQSPVLSAACDGQFKEASLGVIQIEGFDTDTLDKMLRYLYTGSYKTAIGSDDSNSDNAEKKESTSGSVEAKSPSRNSETSMSQKLLSHVAVNAIADYYDLPGLKTQANETILNILGQSWAPQGFSDVVKTVFQTTFDKSLRRIMIGTIVKHMDELVRDEKILQDLMDELSAGVVVGLNSENRGFKKVVGGWKKLMTKLTGVQKSLAQKVYCTVCGALLEWFIKHDELKNEEIEKLTSCLLYCSRCRSPLIRNLD